MNLSSVKPVCKEGFNRLEGYLQTLYQLRQFDRILVTSEVLRMN
jgi:hypothetical protein